MSEFFFLILGDDDEKKKHRLTCLLSRARFSIVGPVGKVSKFEEVLDEATALVKTLVESS
jgi:hypothetical protein